MKKIFDYLKNAVKLLLIVTSLLISETTFSQWKTIDSGVTQNLWDVQFVNDTLGFAVGWNSTILKTIDSGATWAPQSAATGSRLYGVYFKDELNGYAVGKSETSIDGRFRYTIDGGLNWLGKTVFPLPVTDVSWYSIAFSKDKQYGIIVGLDGQIAYSPNGGDNWYKRANIPNGTDPGTIYDVAFYDGNNAIAVGYWGGGGTGFIIKTSNGGNTWENIRNNIVGGLYSISFSDKSNGIAVGAGGVIYMTTDGGNNWVSMKSPTTQTLFGVHFYKNNATAVGAGGVIINSADAGLDWAQQATSNTNNLRSVFKPNASTTVAVGVSGKILFNRPELKVSNLRGEKEFKTLNIEGLSIAADGSSSTQFKYEYLEADKENISLIFKEQLTSNPDFYGSFEPGKIVGDTIIFSYNHPKFFSEKNTEFPDPGFKKLTLQVKNNLGDKILLEYPIKIVRPSLLMAHGIWSNGVGGFGKMEARLLKEKMYKPYQLLKLNYISDQHNSKSINEYVKRKDELKRKALDNNISLGKIDVMGHSNGGLLSRYYIQDPTRYEKDINKLITFNTPHFGSEFANLLLDPKYNYIKNIGKILLHNADNGVIEDLKVNGTFISELNSNLSLDGKYSNIGVHTITSDDLAVNHSGSWVGVFLANLFGVDDVDLFLQDIIFKRPIHDVIVSDLSQIGGCESSTPFPNQWHLSSTENEKFQDTTIVLLNQSPKNPKYFSLNGFKPKMLDAPVFRNSGKFQNKNISTETVTITSPIEGSSYNAGQNVPIVVSGSSGIKKIVTSMGSSLVSIQNHVVENATSANFNFTIPIDALGRIEIVSAVYSANGYENLSSTYINVTTTAILERVSVEEGLIYVTEGQKALITILGHYNDGVTRNINNVTGLNYAFEKNKAKIAESGLVSGILEGEDLLTITYLGKTTTVAITVETNSNLSNIDIDQLTGISVYPNPTKGVLYLKGDLTTLKTVNIYSLTGQHILEIKKEFDLINIESLPSGIYLLKIDTTDTSATIKIIKE